jgi:hypothetical protein
MERPDQPMALEVQKSFPHFLASDDQRPFIGKLGIPGLLLVFTVVMFRSATKPAAIILAFLVGLWAITQFVIVGLVRPEQGCLYYRRFFRWNRLEYKDILKCGHSIIPVLHYLKLKRYTRPLGKFYFIPYSPGPVFGQIERDHKLIQYIRQRIARTSEDHFLDS